MSANKPRRELERTVESAEEVPYALRWIEDLTRKGLAGGAVRWVVTRPSKSRLQEERYHAMIGDIHRQCFRGYSAEGVKAVLVNQFALEMEEQGSPLRHPGEKVWDWKSHEPVYLRPSTTKFTKKEASAFIEFLYATGTDLDVQWSEKALAVYDELCREMGE